MNMVLKEVLWEVTPKCDRRCSFCGSAKIINDKQLSPNDLVEIAHQLAQHRGLGEVNLTGGEPGMLTSVILNDIISILHDAKIDVKVVTNGKFLHCFEVDWEKITAVGLSVNSPQDVEEQSVIPDYARPKTTIITNFGKHNVWDLDAIAKFTADFPCWQVQLTLGKEQLNAQGILHLRQRLSGLKNVIMADNLQCEHSCSSGIRSCGITYKGEVVACLSERAWCGGDVRQVYGVLVGKGKRTLRDVWETEFKDVRFTEEHPSCRDGVHYPEQTEIPPGGRERPPSGVPGTDEWVPPNSVPVYGVRRYVPPRVVMYGVGTGEVTVYGVGTEVYMYAVFKPDYPTGFSEYHVTTTGTSASDDPKKPPKKRSSGGPAKFVYGTVDPGKMKPSLGQMKIMYGVVKREKTERSFDQRRIVYGVVQKRGKPLSAAQLDEFKKTLKKIAESKKPKK
jgi:organic radical activating enzyme